MSIDVQRLVSRRPTSDRTLWIIGTGCFLVALSVFIYLGYSWSWTGLQGKILFDWLEILVQASIPVAVATGAFALNRNAWRRHYEAQKSKRYAMLRPKKSERCVTRL
jgi:TRAP-type C4-dicarboxylate transport system permease small subunit